MNGAVCIDSVAYTCDFFVRSGFDAACRCVLRTDKQRQRRDRRLTTSTVAIVAADSDHLNQWRIAVLKPGKLHLAASAFVASVFWAGAGSAQDAGTLSGVIKDAAGAPVAGAFVQMKNADRRLNFMVITHEGGKYANPRLPAGKYVVQAIGG